jgi:hypothetical protein
VRKKNAAEEALERNLEGCRGEVMVWRARAERLRGENDLLRESNDRLREDNLRLAGQLVDLASRPPPVPPPPPNLEAILEVFRRAVAPDPVVYAGSDGPDEQRRGVNWSDQGLDKTGGTPETVSGPFDQEPVSVPDYVLDVEMLSPEAVRGSRGGWYNPPKGGG